MQPYREIFWNIEYGELLYLLAAIVVIVAIYVLYRRYKLWRLGGPDNRCADFGRRIWAFIVAMVVCLIILVAFPQISLWLPSMMMPGL